MEQPSDIHMIYVLMAVFLMAYCTDTMGINPALISIIMLAASGHRLYFYSNPSRKDPEARMEIDFLIAKSKVTSRHNISPIEVKSGSNYTRG